MHVLASQGTLASEGYTMSNILIKDGHLSWEKYREVSTSGREPQCETCCEIPTCTPLPPSSVSPPPSPPSLSLHMW